MDSSTGGCPLPVDIGGRVVVSAVRRATPFAGPHAIPQGDMVIDMPTDRAQLRRGKPRVDMMDHRPGLRGDVMQDLHKRPKAQIGNFAAPQGFHALKVQCYQGDVDVRSTECRGQIPVEGMAEMSDPFVHTGKVLLGTAAVVRALALVRQRSIGVRNTTQRLFERLWRMVLRPITPREIGRQPKVKACAFTRHGSVDGFRDNATREIHVQVTKPITLDGDRFDGPRDVAGLRKLVDGRAETEAIATKELPSRLFQGKRFGMADLAKGGRTNLVGGRVGLAILQVLKEALIAPVDPFNDVLNGLRT